MNLEIIRLKMDLEKSNRRMNSSTNVNKLTDRVHNEKTSKRFHQENIISEDLCIFKFVVNLVIQLLSVQLE